MSGALPADDSASESSAWAVAARLDSMTGFLVIGHGAASGGASDLFALFSNRTTAGSSAITEGCDSLCPGAVLIFASGLVCGLEAGTVNVAEITARRTKGTFSGTGTCADLSGSPAADSIAFTITNGSFDAAFMVGTPFGALRAAPDAGSLRLPERPLATDQIALNSSNGWLHERQAWMALHAVEPNALRISVAADPQ